MTRTHLPALAVLAALLGCSTTPTVRQVRQTSDGGTILLQNGTRDAAAARQAVIMIEQQCRGVYEILEISQVQTGQTPSAGMAVGFGPIAVGASGSAPIFGSAITYACRPPASTVLNEALIQAASADIVGRRCRSDSDCGPLFCQRPEPAAENGTCSAR